MTPLMTLAAWCRVAPFRHPSGANGPRGHAVLPASRAHASRRRAPTDPALSRCARRRMLRGPTKRKRAMPAVTAARRRLLKAVAAAVITVVIIKQNQIILDSPCNDIDKKIKNIMEFVYVLKTPSENLIEPVVNETEVIVSAKITDKIYNFINDLLFMLVYTGCNDLAELICNDYVNLVIMPQPLINTTTWRTQFDTIIGGGNNTPIGQFIEKIAKKAKLYKEKTRITPDISYDFKICSDPDTHTGVAYLVYNYNQNLNSLITTKSQDNLENKIYEYGKDDFLIQMTSFM